MTFPEGRTRKLAELQALADDQILAGAPSAEEEKRLMDQLRASRELKRVGLRATNIAAAVETRVSVADMQDKVRRCNSSPLHPSLTHGLCS